MGLALLMMASLAVLMGLLLVPRVLDFSTEFLAAHPLPAGWEFMEGILPLLPFIFLILCFFAAFKFLTKGS